MFLKSVPFLFVLLWSTGFIGAKYGLPYIEPFSFLAIRFCITLLLLLAVLFYLKPKFPKNLKSYTDIFISGALIHGGYLGGVFSAIKLGVPAGIIAVVVGLQPVLTTLIIYRLSSPSLLAISLVGFIGLILVVINENTLLNTTNMLIYIPGLIALISITLGTLHYKKHSTDIDFITGIFLQYLPTVIIFVGLAIMFETHATIEWTTDLIFALLWLSIVLSIGAVLLMSMLYKHNSANTAANYFFLVPPVTLIEGYVLFDERLSLLNIVGIGLVVFSIYMSNRYMAGGKS